MDILTEKLFVLCLHVYCIFFIECHMYYSLRNLVVFIYCPLVTVVDVDEQFKENRQFLFILKLLIEYQI